MTSDLLKIFNNQDHGPSPFGLSYHSTWISCGRKGLLKQQEKEAIDDGEQDAFVPNGDKLSYLHVGLYGHKLFEGRLLRGLDVDLLWDARSEVFDINFLEALRLYRAYHAFWGSIEDKWGARVIGAEVGLGDGEVAPRVLQALGGPLTGRADAIIEIIDPDRARANTGLVVMPGRYIFDYKFSKAHGSKDAEKFGPDNLQAQAYLWLDTVEHGENGAIGTIFERLIGHKEITKEKSYASFVVYPQMDSQERLRALVGQSMAHQDNPLPNPMSCTGMWGDVCYFKKSGKCAGY